MLLALIFLKMLLFCPSYMRSGAAKDVLQCRLCLYFIQKNINSLSFMLTGARIFKCLWGPGIDSKE
jgi:hypothetical protein